MATPTSTPRTLAQQNRRLLIMTSLAGLASAPAAPLFGAVSSSLRAVILGAALGGGLALLNHLSRARLNDQKPPRVIAMFAIGGGAGLVGGLLMAAVTALLTNLKLGYIRDLTGHEPPPLEVVVLAGVFYGLLLHAAYALRWWHRHKAVTLGLGTLAGFAAGWLRALLSGARPLDSLLLACFMGIPFALLWNWAVLWCDPAFDFKRWQRFTGCSTAAQEPSPPACGLREMR